MRGTEVRNQPGTLASPSSRRIALSHLVLQAACLPRVNGDFLRRLVAVFPHPFMHHRIFMTVFHRTHKCREHIHAFRFTRWRADIRDEIAAAALML